MGYYFIVIGIVISTVALWGFWLSIRRRFFGTVVVGRIVGIDEQMRRLGHQERRTYYHPIIEFESREGAPFEFTFGTGSSHRRPTIGKTVKVIYPHHRPDQATLNTFMGLWAGPIAATVLAVAALYAGVQVAFFDA